MGKKLRIPPHADWSKHFGEGHEEYWFKCPGCNSDHRIIVRWGDKAGKTEPRWSFNGSLESPTFTPSLLVSWNDGDKKFICHSYMTNGQMQFLSDCTHPRANQTVPMQDVEEQA